MLDGFHNFRHWKATTIHRKTEDTLLKIFLDIETKNNLSHIQLLELLQEERFISKVAMNVKEATQPIELGFEYVTGEYNDGGKIFRKRDLSYLGSLSNSVGSWSSMD